MTPLEWEGPNFLDCFAAPLRPKVRSADFDMDESLSAGGSFRTASSSGRSIDPTPEPGVFLYQGNLPLLDRTPEVISFGSPTTCPDAPYRVVVDYFLARRPVVGLGFDPSYRSHTEVFGGACNVLARAENTSLRADLFGVSEIGEYGKFVDLLGDIKIDGFVERRQGQFNHFIVRIDDAASYLKQLAETGDSVPFLSKVALYGRAIKVAGILAGQSGGTVSVLADYDSSLIIAELLGVLHLVETGGIGAVNLKRIATQSTKGGDFYYSHSTGRRYKTPTQLDQLKTMVGDREKLLSTLEGMAKIMDPSNRNQHGQREGQFLLYDSEADEFNESAADQSKIYEALIDCCDALGDIAESEWETQSANVILQLDSLIDYCRYFTDPPFDKDDFSDTKFVRLLERRLSTGLEFLKLDRSMYSTPQRSLELGAFDLQTGEFCFSTDKRERILIANHFLSTLPNDRTYYRMGLFAPESDLHYSQRASSFVRQWGDPPDRSFVIRAGGILGQDIAQVYRSHPFPPEYWRAGKTEKIGQLAALFFGNEELLTKLDSAFIMSQVDAFNYFAETTSSEYAYTLENWELVKLCDPQSSGEGAQAEPLYRLKRPLIPGERNDLVDRLHMSSDEIEAQFRWAGRNAAPNFFLQRSVFLPREHLSNAKTGMITSIGTAESLCDALNLNPKNRVEDYLKKSKYIYGAYLFQLQASYRYGIEAKDYSPEDINAKIAPLTRSFIEVFKFFLLEQCERGDFTIGAISERYQNIEQELAAQGLSLPTEFDIRPWLEFSKSLLNLNEYQIGQYLYDVEHLADQMGEWYHQFLVGKHFQLVDASYDQHAGLIESFRAIVTNHIAHPRVFREILKILEDKDDQLRLVSLKEKQWLLAIADVTAWLGEVGLVTGKQLSEAIAHFSSARHFAQGINSYLEGAFLSEHTAKRFYEAVQGLQLSLASEAMHSHRLRRLKSLIERCSFGQQSIFS